MAQTKDGAIKRAATVIGISVSEYLNNQEKGLKWCTKCSSWQKVKDFAKDRTRWDGLKSTCFECVRVKTRRDRKGMPSPFKGKKHNENSRHAMSVSRKGNKNRLGKCSTPEQKAYLSRRMREIGNTAKGAKNPRWKGGITPLNRAARTSTEAKDWRKAVFERDQYTCQFCGDNKGGNLQAHHIKSFANHPDLRFEVTNGITLCKPCHVSVHRKKQ